MKTKKIIGYMIIALLAIGTIIAGAINAMGLKLGLFAVGISLAIIWLIALGVILTEEKIEIYERNRKNGQGLA